MSAIIVEKIRSSKVYDLSYYRLKSRSLSSKVRDLRKSRDKWKSESKSKSNEIKRLEKELELVQSNSGIVVGEKISRHKYHLLIVSICVHLYMVGGCSFRGVVEVIKYLNEVLGWGLKEFPSKSSVENWIKKLGYYSIPEEGFQEYEKGYGLIIDECMVVGKERMLAVLGFDSSKSTDNALSFSDVNVLHIESRLSWKKKDISAVIDSISVKMGSRPKYVISDSCNNLCSGIKLASLDRIEDIGHKLALFAEQCYKKHEPFQALNTDMNQARLKYIMKPCAYLLPPKQRFKARFLNLSPVVNWANKTLNIIDTLKGEEYDSLCFIKKHSAMVLELSQLIKFTNLILERFKNQGLSVGNINWALEKCETYSQEALGKMTLFLNKVRSYLLAEKAKMPDEETVWNCSSDIIESIFGYYKYRKASNILHGVTSFALLIALITKKVAHSNILEINIKTAMEAVFLSDIQQWNDDNLVDNQVIKRYQTLNI